MWLRTPKIVKEPQKRSTLPGCCNWYICDSVAVWEDLELFVHFSHLPSVDLPSPILLTQHIKASNNNDPIKQFTKSQKKNSYQIARKAIEKWTRTFTLSFKTMILRVHIHIMRQKNSKKKKANKNYNIPFLKTEEHANQTRM